MKKIKVLSAILATVLASSSLIGVSCADDALRYKKGDVNLDGDISIIDVVMMRGNLIGSLDFDAMTTQIADISKDGTFDIIDIVKTRGIIIGNTVFDETDDTNFVEGYEVFKPENGVTEEMKAASRVSPDANLTRVADVFRRAKAGEELTIGCIGGSITQGSLATDNYGYEKLMREWWEKTFPDAKFTFINAGIGGTDSHFGIYRLERDLLQYKPDFVTVEFSVNDTQKKLNGLTYECLVRKILESEKSPAVMLLFMTQEDGTSLVDVHKPIGEYYNLPMVSYKNAILPVIERGDITWDDISPDNIHPNDAGHKVVMELISSYYEEEILPRLDEIDGTYELPEAQTDQYANAKMVEAVDEEAVNTYLKNFTYGSFDETAKAAHFKSGWKWDATGEDGSTEAMEFDVKAKNISMYYYMMKAAGGKVTVTVTYQDEGDEAPTVRTKTVNADFSKGWGAYTEIVQVCSFDEEHDLHVQIQPVYNEAKPDMNKFTIYAFGIS